MRNRRLVRAAAVFSGLALVLAACGDDDDDDTDTGSATTEAPSDETTTTASEGGGGGGGELEGMKGTTPLPETTDTVERVLGRPPKRAFIR